MIIPSQRVGAAAKIHPILVRGKPGALRQTDHTCHDPFSDFHGDDDGARKDIGEALRLDPRLGNAYKFRAFIRLDEGNYAGADADYTRAMEC